MPERLTLPVLPLRGTVIFPGLTVPIAVGRPRTLRAIEAAMKAGSRVFAVAQREEVDEPRPDQLYTMGVIANIGQVQRGLGASSFCFRVCSAPMPFTTGRPTPTSTPMSCRSTRWPRSMRTTPPSRLCIARRASAP